MNFEDKLEQFEKAQGVPHEEETIVVAKESLDQQDDLPQNDPVEPITPDAPVAAPVNTPIVENQPDYNKFLEESSGGVFKSVDDLKSHLPKIQHYDTLEAQRKEYEDKLNGLTPFAKKYDDLVKAGKSKDVIDSFVRINQLGELSELTPFQLKVEALVQDGYARDFAQRKVTKDFNLNIDVDGVHLTDDEREANKLLLADNQEELRISALKDDLPKLNDLKVKLEDTKDYEAENKIVAEKAQLLGYQEKLKPLVAKLAVEYTGIGSINVNGGEGDKAKVMSFDADPEFKAEVEQRLYDWFKDGTKPVNDTTVNEAKEYLGAVYLYRNREKLLKSAYNQGVTDAKDSAINEYENKSGLPISGLPPVARAATSSILEQQRKAALGEDD